MRIERNQMIVGYPVRSVRQLMRETLGRPITVRWVSETLGCSDDAAAIALADLQREGWVCKVGDHLVPSLQGSALAQATAAKPLTRCTADKLIADVLLRAKMVNRQKKYAYRVEKLVVFGSYLMGQSRLNDVDIGVRLVPRWIGDAQRRAEQRRRDEHRADFRNMSQWALWPKLEVLRFLRSRSRGLSIQEMSDWIEHQTEHLVIFTPKTTGTQR